MSKRYTSTIVRFADGRAIELMGRIEPLVALKRAGLDIERAGGACIEYWFERIQETAKRPVQALKPIETAKPEPIEKQETLDVDALIVQETRAIDRAIQQALIDGLE